MPAIQQVASVLFVLLMVDVASAGSLITSFWFNNWCDYDVELADWWATIPAGESWNIDWERSDGWPYQRIAFRFVGDDAYDFIEMNGEWTGQGQYTNNHWSYSTYNGFNMGSKYEAWDPDNSWYACSDAGAVVDFDGAWGEGVCDGGNGYSCAGSNDCGTTISDYMRDHSYVINGDFSWTQLYDDGRAGNFWCDEAHGFPPSWVYGGVGTLIDCVDNGVPFKLVVSTCPEQQPYGWKPNTTAASKYSLSV